MSLTVNATGNKEIDFKNSPASVRVFNMKQLEQSFISQNSYRKMLIPDIVKQLDSDSAFFLHKMQFYRILWRGRKLMHTMVLMVLDDHLKQKS